MYKKKNNLYNDYSDELMIMFCSNFRLDKNMLDEKIQSAKDAKIDEKFYPTQMLYPSSKTNQYMLNLGKHIFIVGHKN